LTVEHMLLLRAGLGRSRTTLLTRVRGARAPPLRQLPDKAPIRLRLGQAARFPENLPLRERPLQDTRDSEQKI